MGRTITKHAAAASTATVAKTADTMSDTLSQGRNTHAEALRAPEHGGCPCRVPAARLVISD